MRYSGTFTNFSIRELKRSRVFILNVGIDLHFICFMNALKINI